MSDRALSRIGLLLALAALLAAVLRNSPGKTEVDFYGDFIISRRAASAPEPDRFFNAAQIAVPKRHAQEVTHELRDRSSP